MTRKIPRTMSTQHPDNANVPFFSNNPVLQGDDEIKEAYYAFSYLGVDEVMWDVEGKETDEFVIRKLVSDYPEFFKQKVIGKDIFITLRVPNPNYEKAEGKLLIETLESIPRSYDTAYVFYQDESVVPIFEVIVPMADTETCNRVYYYYKNVVAGKEDKPFCDTNPQLKLKDWIGEFRPKKINVIPLFEDIDNIINVDKNLKEFLKDKLDEVEYQRVFLARSDPAMNYSSLSVIIAIKLALEKLYELQESLKLPIYPILGCGTAPFRGNFSPNTYRYVINNYPSVATFTIQSAFKYDFPVKEVQRAIENINLTPVKSPNSISSKDRVESIMYKVSSEYKKQLAEIAPLVNNIAVFVPKRRARKIHVGLFGYSRQTDEGITLPRVISFCAVLYSLGLPPDILGLSALTDEDIKYVESVFPRFKEEMSEILSMWNEDVLDLLPVSIRSEIKQTVKRFDFEINQEHLSFSKDLVKRIKENKFDTKITDLIVASAKVRNFLG
ncbi:phosphoenolpyruvate carboxylase [Dictyoglomus thermophilum]|uniref:Phosphoenolpyruvate carboxylase n=1 Tax=Dictyoglomus thermophilum (strain ATCC 35947 / DSM 3960 / H-6-12) TaxID=309799 RepID=B5YCF7_DICT6|nr:phosphoenolpyruvate carboxylase [Dictyoglomus thermophilum]ACI19088.1 phosphoenolpyruvate carboxylase [Dictyoglomus thermophilum H-6-12]